MANSNKAKAEVIVIIGVEGGGATICRTPLASGGWLYHVEGSSMWMLEDMDEAWSSWTKEPVQTIQEALRSLADDGSWVFYYAALIHPDYRNAVRILVEEIVSKLPEQLRKRWKDRNRQNWQRRWRPEPPDGPANSDLFGNPIQS